MKHFASVFLAAILFFSVPGFSVLAIEKGTPQPPDTADLKPNQ